MAMNEKDAKQPKNPGESKLSRSRYEMPIVTVIGGGIAGLTAAHEMIERGFRVFVVEKEKSDRREERCKVGGMAANQYGRVPESLAELYRSDADKEHWSALEKLRAYKMIEVSRREVFSTQFPLQGAEGAPAFDANAKYELDEYIRQVKKANRKYLLALAKLFCDVFFPSEEDLDFLPRDEYSSKLFSELKLVPGLNAKGIMGRGEQLLHLRDAWIKTEGKPEEGMQACHDHLRRFLDGKLTNEVHRFLFSEIFAKEALFIKVICTVYSSREAKEAKASAVEVANQAKKRLMEEGAADEEDSLTSLVGSQVEAIGEWKCPEDSSQDGRVFLDFKIIDRLIPGEHGFRFFPSFYRHLFDIMKRTPVLDDLDQPTGETAFDQLVPVSQMEVARRDGMPDLTIKRGPPSSLSEWRESLYGLWNRLGISTHDINKILIRCFKYVTSSPLRREKEYEDISWTDFLGGLDNYSSRGGSIVSHLPRALAGMRPQEVDARTHGNIQAQLLLDFMTTALNKDMQLNGPTTEAWLDPWRRYLTRQGVQFLNGELMEFSNAADGELRPVFGLDLPKGLDAVWPELIDKIKDVLGEPVAPDGVETWVAEFIDEPELSKHHLQVLAQLFTELSKSGQAPRKFDDYVEQLYRKLDLFKEGAPRVNFQIKDLEFYWGAKAQSGIPASGAAQGPAAAEEKTARPGGQQPGNPKKGAKADPPNPGPGRRGVDKTNIAKTDFPQIRADLMHIFRIREDTRLETVAIYAWIFNRYLQFRSFAIASMEKFPEFARLKSAPPLNINLIPLIVQDLYLYWDGAKHELKLESLPRLKRLLELDLNAGYRRKLFLGSLPDVCNRVSGCPTPEDSDFFVLAISVQEASRLIVRHVDEQTGASLIALRDQVREEVALDYNVWEPKFFRDDFEKRQFDRLLRDYEKRREEVRKNVVDGDLLKLYHFAKDGDLSGPTDISMRDDTGKPKEPMKHPYRDISGIQYFYIEKLRIGKGYVYYPESPWALTSISQPDRWRMRIDPHRPYFGQNTVDIGNFYARGLVATYKTAWNCSAGDIARETFSQLITALEQDFQYSFLFRWNGPAVPNYYFLDSNLEFGIDRNGRPGRLVRNRAPFLINLPGKWQLRPGLLVDPESDGAVREIRYTVSNKRWVLAGTFMATHTRMTSMEAACESGRLAVNAILAHLRRADPQYPEFNSAGMSAGQECEIWPLEDQEPGDFRPFKELDEELARKGLPHFLDILGIIDWVDRNGMFYESAIAAGESAYKGLKTAAYDSLSKMAKQGKPDPKDFNGLAGSPLGTLFPKGFGPYSDWMLKGAEMLEGYLKGMASGNGLLKPLEGVFQGYLDALRQATAAKG